uniref:Phosphoribosyl pyrophosphate amidotransferase n=1 Tax=Ficedula albicollis TaxID=59894 RepID=A0A803WC90_FICAL
MELEELGIREECGVFGCIASGAWPTELDVPHVLTLGLVGLQHSIPEAKCKERSSASCLPSRSRRKRAIERLWTSAASRLSRIRSRCRGRATGPRVPRPCAEPAAWPRPGQRGCALGRGDGPWAGGMRPGQRG